MGFYQVEKAVSLEMVGGGGGGDVYSPPTIVPFSSSAPRVERDSGLAEPFSLSWRWGGDGGAEQTELTFTMAVDIQDNNAASCDLCIVQISYILN